MKFVCVCVQVALTMVHVFHCCLTHFNGNRASSAVIPRESVDRDPILIQSYIFDWKHCFINC